MLTAALFITAKNRKQPSCPTIGNRVNWKISYKGILFSDKRK